MKTQGKLAFIKKGFSYFTISDIILVIGVLILAFILLYSSVNHDNQLVRISYKNKPFGEYKLNKPQIIKITQDIEVEIADSQVRMLKNNCPNQLCVEQGWSDNYPIICVPNQVEIIILDEKSKDEIRHILK